MLVALVIMAAAPFAVNAQTGTCSCSCYTGICMTGNCYTNVGSFTTTSGNCAQSGCAAQYPGSCPAVGANGGSSASFSSVSSGGSDGNYNVYQGACPCPAGVSVCQCTSSSATRASSVPLRIVTAGAAVVAAAHAAAAAAALL